MSRGRPYLVAPGAREIVERCAGCGQVDTPETCERWWDRMLDEAFINVEPDENPGGNERMARLALGAAIGVVVGLVVGAASGIRAQQLPTEETVAAADEAGVDALDLQGASNTTQLDPRTYLIAVGELVVHIPAMPTEPPPPGWPIGGVLGQRIFCVEGIESHHGQAMWNPTPVWDGEHAAGFLGFLPSTARRWGVTIGNRASEWDGARRMLMAGAGSQFYGVAAGLC